jgi:ABC-type nitrate/sulfonate/bicarbonate transport system substrate-binding protein
MKFNFASNAVSGCLGLTLVVLGASGFSAAARAEDQLKVAIGQINNWENQAPTLGQDAGIFKRHNLVLENVGTQGAGETMQPVIAGSADVLPGSCALSPGVRRCAFCCRRLRGPATFIGT